jgi:hypothetical protein
VISRTTGDINERGRAERTQVRFRRDRPGHDSGTDLACVREGADGSTRGDRAP